MGAPGNGKRKVVASTLLIAVPALMFVRRPVPLLQWGFFQDQEFAVFTIAAFVFLVISAILAFAHAGWKIREPGITVWDFVRLFLSRYFVGEMITSLYGLLLFVIFAVILTAWLPESIMDRNPLLTAGFIAYFIGTILITAWVFPPKVENEPDDDRPAPVDYLVYALSLPGNWSRVREIECERLKKNPQLNSGPINILPLYVSMYYHLNPHGKLRGVYLLTTEKHTENTGETGKDQTSPRPLKKEVREELRSFLEKASECLGVRFIVHWPLDRPESIGNGEREVFIKFVHVGDGNIVKEVYQSIASSEIEERIKESLEGKGEVSFNITGGTAVMSSAMILHAIRGSVHAEYVKQGAFDMEPAELLQKIDLNIFDLDTLVRELRDYFERQYQRELTKQKRGGA
ncbi:hypothetical protein [Thermococcus zilligii]|uniref:hypothetical protein n=1 Tax=Thermococcus zilligii TaxID=54076 RepID=UPI00029AFAD0|nr:hypothetical protein [Thermococcus zilligii]